MAGLGKKLASLVQAADDPEILVYAYTHLDVSVLKNDPQGFRRRVEAVRCQLVREWLNRGAIKPQKEGQLAMQLFQKGTLNVIARRFCIAKSEALKQHVLNEDPLVRFLAIQSIGRRHLHLESELIELLNDPDTLLRDASHAALIRVSRGTDFGPYPGASKKGMACSLEKWKNWLALQQSASPDTLAKQAAIAAAGKQAQAPPLEIVPLVLVGNVQPELPVEALKLTAELVNATGDEQIALLARLRDSKGIDNTDALALAIPKLSGDTQRQARDALAQRLTRMTAATLRDKLQDDNVEVRRAAASACGRKKAKEHIPDLLQLLDDPEKDVVQSVRVALIDLTGEDFGPTHNADHHRRADAVAAWRKWWKERCVSSP